MCIFIINETNSITLQIYNILSKVRFLYLSICKKMFRHQSKVFRHMKLYLPAKNKNRQQHTITVRLRKRKSFNNIFPRTFL